jgi:hypothetical protein
VLIGALGLTLGLLCDLNGVEGFLPVYGLLFLLAIPLLWCAAPVLFGVATALVAVGPVLIVATANAGLPYAGVRSDPTLATLIHDAMGLLVQLFLTGVYPAVVYLRFLCVGLAIGRLDLRSRWVGLSPRSQLRCGSSKPAARYFFRSKYPLIGWITEGL